MIKVKISKAIAYEYEARGVYDFIGKAGTYNLKHWQAKELKDDSLYQSLYVNNPSGTDKAYNALFNNLDFALTNWAETV